MRPAELYDHTNNTWISAGTLAQGRLYSSGTLLPDGRVLVAGGFSSGEVASAEIFDPPSNSWSAAGALSVARSFHTVALLPDGLLLVTGGYNGEPHAVTDAYDVRTHRWTPYPRCARREPITSPSRFATAGFS